MYFLWQITSKSRQIWVRMLGADFLFKGIAFVFWQIWSTYAGGDFLFKVITFGFWDFLVQIQGDFCEEIFCFWEILVLGYVSGGKCLDHKKKASNGFTVSKKVKSNSQLQNWKLTFYKGLTNRVCLSKKIFVGFCKPIPNICGFL